MRSKTAFFYDTDTLQSIEDIAALAPLTVYAGAGVTIDRTGLSWSALIVNLFDRVGVEGSLAWHLVDELEPDRAATILTQQYEDVHPRNSESQLRNELRALLYRNGDWLVGKLTEAVAALLGQHGAVHGAVVFTTNYDDYLESALERVSEVRKLRELSSFELRRFTRSARPQDVRHEKGVVKIVYLHGFVPRQDASLSPFGGIFAPKDLDPVLSESDYVTAGKIYEPLLIQALSEASVLILGSSMTDPPLIRALHSRKDTLATSVHAVVSMQERFWNTNSLAHRDKLQELVERRFVQLNVKPVFTDFFGQIGQFVQEVAIRTEALQPSGDEAAPVLASYTERVEEWWESIEARFFQGSTQAEDSHSLYGRLLEIRRLLKAPEEERLKLELWVRWRPGMTSRKFRLWASSVGSINDSNLMRDAEIDNSDEYLSIKAFTLGRPIITEDPEPSRRWRTYLLIPIRTSARFAEVGGMGDAIVGVMALASMRPQSDSSMRWANSSRLESVAQLMRGEGNHKMRP